MQTFTSFVKKIGNKILDYKIYIGRATSYITLANTGMILILFLSKLQDYGIVIPIKEWGLVIYVGTVMICVLLGYLDVKYGLYKAETSKAQQQNPELLHIIRKLDEIEKKIK